MGDVVHGLLLAAGAGRRMGGPKALVRDDAGQPWLTRSVQVLLYGGCEAVTVVLGAAADEAARLLVDEVSSPARVDFVLAADWAEGMGASLRTGLQALQATDAEAALVHLVDLPDVGAEVIARMAALGAGPAALARASYDGTPGHPVLLGRDHWQPILESTAGDAGARTYLAGHDTTYVECGDLATGRDVDRPTGNQRPST